MARIPMIEQRAQVERGGEAAFDLIAESRGKVAGPFAGSRPLPGSGSSFRGGVCARVERRAPGRAAIPPR